MGEQGYPERVARALDQLAHNPGLRTLAGKVEEGSGGGGRRGWDRRALLARLRTFGPSTWFSKPAAISAANCARRGWRNAGSDLLICQDCGARVMCPVSTELEPAEAEAWGERHLGRLAAAHKEGCMWAGTVAPAELLRLPRLLPSVVRADAEARLGTMRPLLCLPPLAGGAWATSTRGGVSAEAGAPSPVAAALADLASTGRGAAAAASDPLPPRADALARLATAVPRVAPHGSAAFSLRAAALAALGWEARPAGRGDGAPSDALLPPPCWSLACGLCGAEVGGWALFGCGRRASAGGGKRGAGQIHATSGGSQVPRSASRLLLERLRAEIADRKRVREADAPDATASTSGPGEAAPSSPSAPIDEPPRVSAASRRGWPPKVDLPATVGATVGPTPSGSGTAGCCEPPSPGPFGRPPPKGAPPLFGPPPPGGVRALARPTPPPPPARPARPPSEAGGGEGCALPSRPIQYVSKAAWKAVGEAATTPFDPVLAHRPCCPWLQPDADPEGEIAGTSGTFRGPGVAAAGSRRERERPSVAGEEGTAPPQACWEGSLRALATAARLETAAACASARAASGRAGTSADPNGSSDEDLAPSEPWDARHVLSRLMEAIQD